MDTAGFSDNFDGSEFNAHRSIKTSSENNEGYGGFDNPCLEEEDPPATLPVTQDDITSKHLPKVTETPIKEQLIRHHWQ